MRPLVLLNKQISNTIAGLEPQGVWLASSCGGYSGADEGDGRSTRLVAADEPMPAE